MTPTPTQDADPARDSDERFCQKMRAETTKMRTENQWRPAIVASTVTLAIVVVTKLFL